MYTDDSFNRLELGLYFGGGLQKELGVGSIVLDARFGLGLTDLNNEENKPDDYEPIKFNNYTVSIGYMIPLGGKKTEK